MNLDGDPIQKLHWTFRFVNFGGQRFQWLPVQADVQHCKSYQCSNPSVLTEEFVNQQIVSSCVPHNIILPLTMNPWVTQHFGWQMVEYFGTSSLFKDVWGGIKPFKDDVKKNPKRISSHHQPKSNHWHSFLTVLAGIILEYKKEKKIHCAVSISMFCNHMLHFHYMKMYLQVDFVYCSLLKFTIMFLS